MPAIRIERVPVQTFNLGLIGFDHLQLVYQQEPTDIGAVQDNWFVMEGLREPGPDGLYLAVEGWDGGTSLSDANGGAFGEELEERIGTPAGRGSRAVVTGGDALNSWATMVSFAGDINSQAFPYISFSLPGSPVPTINSSSLIASLLFYVGIDIASIMPFGTRLAPGATTLLGSSGDDDLSIVNGFTTIVGGAGNDTLHGSNDQGRIDKLFGGKDDDRFQHSAGFNIFHGGQTGLAYEKDGIDTVDYIGAGTVRIDANPYAAPHYRPDFIATSDNGLDHLFSIERIEWNETSDHIILGDGVGLLEDSITLKLGLEDSAGQGDVLDYSAASEGLVFNPGQDHLIFVQAASHAETREGLWVDGAEWLIGSSGDDRIYAAPAMRGAEGGGGNDLIDARSAVPFAGESPRGFDIEIDGGAGSDTILSGSGRTAAKGGDGADRFVLSTVSFTLTTVEFVIEDAGEEDRAFVPYDFFNITYGDAEGSALFPLLGAMAQQPGHATFADLPENLGPWYGGPSSRSDFFAFEWQLEHDRLYGSDQSDGVLTFAGAILYNREGDDLLIHVFVGFPRQITELGSNDEPWTHLVNVFIPPSEAIIRVEDFVEGDLGIFFHDPGEPEPIDIETDHGSYGAYSYPGWDAAVQAMTNGGVLASPIEARPAPPVYEPDDLGPGDDQNIVLGTSGGDVIALAGTEDTTVESGEGDDTIETGSGDDVLDGGAGADQMTGGAGDDVYIAGDTGDTVIELAQGGIDRVQSSVDFVLPDFVEHLTLVDGVETVALLAAAPGPSGTGNGLANRLIGSEGDNALSGLGGNDTLYGGTGSDTLEGGEGNDGYVYVAGDGDDIIRDTGSVTDRDVLVLGGLTPGEVAFHRLASAPSDLVVTFSSGGRILIEGFGNGAGIEAMSFDDGTAWSRAELEAHAAVAPILAGDPPQAQDDFDLVATGNNVLIPWEALTANDRDYDGDPLSIVAISAVSAGASVTIEGGNLRLVTAPGFEGLVSFAYEVSDGNGGSATALAEIAVLPGEAAANTPPVAADDHGFATTIGVPLDIVTADLTSNDEDADGNTVSIVSVGGAAHGTAALASGVIQFTPDAGYSGPASFTYTIEDGAGGSATASVTVDVSAPEGNVITGSGNGETLEGTSGADYIDGRGGDDVIHGRGGADIFRVIGRHNGLDLFNGGGGVDRILGGSGDDVIGLANVAGHLAGIEEIDGGDGFDVIRLSGGNDTLNLAGIEVTSIEAIEGGDGDDIITGSDGGNRIDGGAGNDKLTGRGGDDVFAVSGAGYGFDVFKGGTGIDRIEGSADDDVIGLADAGGNLSGIEIVDGGEGFDVIQLTEGDDRLNLSEISVQGIERIDAGAGNDIVTGSDGANWIVGGAGNDKITGLGGDDVFEVSGAGDGFDIFKGGEGIDRIQGSAGDDVIGLADAGANLDGIELIDGGEGFDIIRLTSGNDKLDLSQISVTGLEAIEGGEGNDQIIASTANDILSGGAGNDSFVFRPGFGRDVITDFELGTIADPNVDRIDIRSLGVDNLAELLSLAEHSGADTLITFDPATSLTLANVALEQLRADDFRFA